MSKKAGLLVVLITGLVWGLVEIYVGDVFYRFHIPFRSAILTAIGMGGLVAARRVLDKPGSSLAAGVLAGIIRCAVPKVYICHAVAIAIEACAFDATWTLMRAGERQTLRRAWLAGAVAIYSGFFAFGLASLYLFKFGKWTAGGWSGIGMYCLRSGSMALAAFIVLAPLALRAGQALAAHVPGHVAGAPGRNGVHPDQ
jgi:thiamine transporter ThiT